AARHDLLDHRADDLGVLEQQVIARHAGLAREPGRDDDDVRARRLLVAVAAHQRRVVPVDGPGLGEVERLALRDTLDDVHQHDVTQLLLHRVLGDGGADVASAHHGDLGTRHSRSLHYSFAMFWMMAVPNSEHFTSLAPSMSRAKS